MVVSMFRAVCKQWGQCSPAWGGYHPEQRGKYSSAKPNKLDEEAHIVQGLGCLVFSCLLSMNCRGLWMPPWTGMSNSTEAAERGATDLTLFQYWFSSLLHFLHLSNWNISFPIKHAIKTAMCWRSLFVGYLILKKRLVLGPKNDIFVLMQGLVGLHYGAF